MIPEFRLLSGQTAEAQPSVVPITTLTSIEREWLVRIAQDLGVVDPNNIAVGAGDTKIVAVVCQAADWDQIDWAKKEALRPLLRSGSHRGLVLDIIRPRNGASALNVLKEGIRNGIYPNLKIVAQE